MQATPGRSYVYVFIGLVALINDLWFDSADVDLPGGVYCASALRTADVHSSPPSTFVIVSCSGKKPPTPPTKAFLCCLTAQVMPCSAQEAAGCEATLCSACALCECMEIIRQCFEESSDPHGTPHLFF
eukprot:4521568-Amphidinium_carterae.3